MDTSRQVLLRCRNIVEKPPPQPSACGGTSDAHIRAIEHFAVMRNALVHCSPNRKRP